MERPFAGAIRPANSGPRVECQRGEHKAQNEEGAEEKTVCCATNPSGGTAACSTKYGDRPTGSDSRSPVLVHLIYDNSS